MPRVVVYYSSPWVEGSYGAICATASDLIYVQGYDEQFLPSGCQDTDLIERLKLAGLTYEKRTGDELVGFVINNDTPKPEESHRQAHICRHCFRFRCGRVRRRRLRRRRMRLRRAWAPLLWTPAG